MRTHSPPAGATGLGALRVLGPLLLGALLPTTLFAQDCPEGRVGQIEIRNATVFQPTPTQPYLIRTVQSAANFIHIRTRESVIRQELLLDVGDCLDDFRLAESERVLDAQPHLAQARIEVVERADGDHLLIVHTRDEWSLEASLRTSYDEGLNLEHFRFNERNFLGRGIITSGSITRFQDDESQHFQLIVPRVIGRMRIDTFLRDAPRGHYIFHQYVHPFSNEADRVAWRQLFTADVSEFVYSTGNLKGLSHVIVPLRRDWHETAFLYRFGEPGRQVLLGTNLVHHYVRFPDTPLGAFDREFDDLPEVDLAESEALDRHLVGERATRLSLHLAIRRYGFEPFVGLDSPRGREMVPLGWYVGGGIGTGFRPGQDFVKFHANMGARVGDGLVKALVNVDTGIGNGWRDLIAEGYVAAYLRHSSVPHHTLFLSASGAGGWNTAQPFQLTLGGRRGVRSLVPPMHPGGMIALFVAEDRISLPWPRTPLADFGLTLFADAGRTWAGDVPFGQGSDGWVGSVGAGLRVSFPSGSRNTLRPDIVFPVGHSGSPIFRVTYEAYRVRGGFSPPGVGRSKWFGRGAEQF